MNKSNQKLLNDGLKGLVKRLEKTEKFVLDQAPDICKQMIQEELIEIYVIGIFSLAASIIGIFMLILSLLNGITEVRHGYDQPTIWLVVFIGSILCIGFGVTTCVTHLKYYLFVTKCPKLFLLRSFKKLVK